MRTWEYVISPLDKKELDKLGAEGWEAVGIAPAGSSQGAALTTTKLFVLLKQQTS